MKNIIGRVWPAIIACAVMLTTLSGVGCRKGPGQAEIRAAVETAMASGQKGRDWLKGQQLPDGTFDPYDQVKVGMTSLAIVALMDQEADPNDPNMQRAVAFISSRQKDDGSIRIVEGVENYETALSVLALRKTGNKVYDEAIAKGQQYLAQLQMGGKGDVGPENASYGGIGYGRRQTPDLSNTQFALEALKAGELGADAETFQRAKVFIERCQNLKKVNQQPWAGNDGGFIYMPGLSLANEKAAEGDPRHSYGSMSYAGLLSFAYCDVPKGDERVRAALDWLRKHYTLEENPGMGKSGLFYYYMVMAKALSAYGEKHLTDEKGVRHFWALDLVNKLASIQHPDGHWVNTDARWMENNKSLVTAYCMITLNKCRRFLEE